MNNQYAWIVLYVSIFLNTVISLSVSAAEIEEAVLGMNVSGNKEAPNILYIIPWKDNSDGSTPPEVTRLMDEIYSTVDPDVYQKEVIFFEKLTEDNTIIKAK